MNVKTLYSIFQRSENRVGGGEGVIGIYGSLNAASMEKILTAMHDRCGLCEQSHLIDIGSGLGRPLLHAAYIHHVGTVSGIEIDSIKCTKAAVFSERVWRILEERRLVSCQHAVVPPIQCMDVAGLDSLDATHCYTFWEGMPPDTKRAIGRLFKSSPSMRTIAVVQRSMRFPVLTMSIEHGFGELHVIDSFPVRMTGGGCFFAYICTKDRRSSSHF